MCGSGEKFKRCCSDCYSASQPGTRVYTLLREEKHEEALTECRAGITQYTIWHKSHTEPAVRAGFSEILPLLELDIKVLSQLVHTLFTCYVKADRLKDFPATLERLRANIDHVRWQRKITYFHALHALWPNRNKAAGRKELERLGSVDDETDIEILHIYVDLFGESLSFSERQRLTDRVLQFCETDADRLQYRGLKAIGYLLIGDERRAAHELENGISAFRKSKKERTDYDAYRFAQSLELLGSIRKDANLLREALQLCKALLSSDDWTRGGRAQLYRLIGEIHRHNEAWEESLRAYSEALQLGGAEVDKVFQSECLLHLGSPNEAIELIGKVQVQQLDERELVDYAFGLAVIGIETGDRGLLTQAEALLKSSDPAEPYFRQRRDSLLLGVVEAQREGPSAKRTERARQGLRRIARYLILQPNIMGLGVDVGKVVEDLTKGADAHSAGTPNKRVERHGSA